MPDAPDPTTPLLQPLETAVVPATTSPLVIRDYFKKMSRAQFCSIFNEFKTRFFDKTENPIPETTYRKYQLLRISPDGPIIAELGGASKVEGTVTGALALIERQGSGGPGPLQTSGYANIFYSRDSKGELCAIRVGWGETGWLLDAISVKDPLAWNGRHDIFCPVSGQG
jgi:hypothetical protein